MRTNFFCTNFLKHPQGSGTSRQKKKSRDIPDSSLRNPRKTNFRGRAWSFSATTPSQWKTPTPPGGLRTQKVYLCALFLSLWKKTHWVRCLKPYSPKPYSARFRDSQDNTNATKDAASDVRLSCSCWCWSLSLSLYIYICCEVIIWAKFGHFRCYYLGQVGVIIWAKLFLAYKNSGFEAIFGTHSYHFVFFFCAQLSGSHLKIAFFKKGCKNWVFQISVF